MPKFFIHTVKAPSTMRNQLNLLSLDLDMQSRPLGTIAETFNYSYYYDGTSYKVTVGFLKYLAAGRNSLTLDQAKALYNACVLEELDPMFFPYEKMGDALKVVRKSKLTGDDLMFLWIDLLF
jgi:hypothetical protein